MMDDSEQRFRDLLESEEGQQTSFEAVSKNTHLVTYHQVRLTPEFDPAGDIWTVHMDGLKQINDRFGHDQGSVAIAKVAELLRQTFRESDILARMGGDEFVALTIAATDDDEPDHAGETGQTPERGQRRAASPVHAVAQRGDRTGGLGTSPLD